MTVLVTLVSLFACALLARRASMEAVRFESNALAKINQSSPGLRKSRLQPIVQNYWQLPIAFEANQGQTDARVKFMSRGSGYNLYLTPTEAVLTLRKEGKAKTVENQAAKRNLAVALDPRGHQDTQSASVATATVRMKLVGGNEKTEVAGVDEQSAKVNYFIGNDPAKWRTDIPTYARVQYKDVYRGVDLVYHGQQQQLEYDFVVKPGADPHQIRLRFGGANKIRIDESGELVLTTKSGEVRQHKPLIYQEAAGGRNEIAGTYSVKANREVGFEIGSYDNSQTLVIDPVLSYSTYLGGSSIDVGVGIKVDSTGSAYVTGYTQSTNFPTLDASQPSQGGGYDAFVTRLTASGALSYSTYLGGDGNDQGFGIAFDSGGDSYVTGATSSTNFPTLNAYQEMHANDFGNPDAFVTKLMPSGGLSYSTYLGGNFDEAGNAIAVDSDGNAFVTGYTQSGNFPTLNAYQATKAAYFDVFVTKLTPSGGLSYSTYLGSDNNEVGRGIDIDTAGNAYIAGYTNSTDFPTLNASQASKGGGNSDAFVTKLTASGGLSFSTYLGGDSDDQGYAIAVDIDGNPHVTGYTQSTNFPTVNAYQGMHGSDVGSPDAFVTKLTTIGGLSYSTYLGGNGDDLGVSIAVDSASNAYVTGLTFSTNLPTQHGCQTCHGGSYEAFVTKLTASGGLSYLTYLGGSGADVGLGISVDLNNNAYVTGYTQSTNFPTLNASQSNNGGNYDAFITKLVEAACSSNLSISGSVPDFCETNFQPINLTLNGTSLADSDITWSLSGPSSNPNLGTGANLNTSLSGLTAGSYTISATATNADCPDTSTLQNFVVAAVIPANAGPDQAFCGTASATLAGNTPSPGTGTWTLVSGMGTIIDPTNPTSGVSNLGYGDNSFRWTIINGSCSSSDDVVIARSPCPTNITLFGNRDSFLRSGSDDTNEGANERLRIQNSGNNRAVIAFDLTGVSTGGLQSATLILNIAENSNNWGTSGRVVDAQPLLVDWSEGNGRNDVMVGGGPGFRGSGQGVTWNCAIDTNILNQVANCSPLWNGGNYAAATAPGVLHTNGLLGQVSWDVTADILAGANFGWAIRKQNENQNGQVRYYSREGAALAGNPNLGPRLVLVYSH